jgi:hypothetical protein
VVVVKDPLKLGVVPVRVKLLGVASLVDHAVPVQGEEPGVLSSIVTFTVDEHV